MAGLAAAHTIAKTAREQHRPVDWHLFESTPRLGGKIVTEAAEGFIIEGGPDSFITQKPWGLDLCRDLGLEDEYLPCNTERQKVYILVKGRLRALPAGFRLTVPTRIIPFLISPLFSWPAKLRMGLEAVLPPRRDDADESVYNFISRRLGREAAEKIGGALMAGIFVADPKKLSILATFPMFRALEKKHGSLIRSMRATARQRAGEPSLPLFMSLKPGMSRLVERISEPLLDRCHTHTPITGLAKEGDHFTVTTADGPATYDAVILATPLYQTAKLLQSIAPDMARQLEAIRYVSTATISLGFALPLQGMKQPLDGFGFVVPAAERRTILACTWSSIKFNQRAPEHHVLFRVFVGGEGLEEWVEQPDDKLLHRVRTELADILGIQSEPVITRIYRWPQGNPQYDVGHAERMNALMSTLETIPGLHLAGSGYNGIGLPDCIRSGREAALKLW